MIDLTAPIDVIGCLLIDLVMLIDSYRNMIVRFASQVTSDFLSPLLCLSLDILFPAKENLWDQGKSDRQGSKFELNVDMEVSFLVAEARGPSLRVRFFLLPFLPLRVRASGTTVKFHPATSLVISSF